MIDFEHYDYVDEWYARPSHIFDWLHAQKFCNWFPSTSTLFHQNKPLTNSQQTLISFESGSDALLFSLSQRGARLLRDEWWEIFENETYKSHPIFPEIEMSRNCHVRISGKQKDDNDRVQITRVLDGILTAYCSRTVNDLLLDIWSTSAT